ncbi:MAG: hypothetical protein Hals2KO_14730 [Halioglobus sp.]
MGYPKLNSQLAEFARFASENQRPSQKKQEMLLAAEAIVRSSGFEGLSLRKVAVAVGVKLPSVQHHFGTKSGLVAALVEFSFQRYSRELIDLVEHTSDEPEQNFERAIDYLLGTLKEPPGVEPHLWAYATYESNASSHKERYVLLYCEFVFHLIHELGTLPNDSLCRHRAAQVVALVEGFYLILTNDRPSDLQGYEVELKNTIFMLAGVSARR